MGSKHEILLGLTTTPKSDWRGKVEEMKKFGIKKIALFPTFLRVEQRKELYELLEQIEDLEIPHVHLRDDMEQWELDLFENKYKTQLYNVHIKHVSVLTYRQYLSKIYVENHFCILPIEVIESCAGICFDVSHLESSRIRRRSEYAQIIDTLKKYTVGCCHISGVNKNLFNIKNYFIGFDRHYMKNLKELDYIGQYRQYLPYYISLELENSFEQQLRAKEYIEKIINT
ncbi:MAG: hypothetical protein US57_C0013G0008 [Candidatus Moranbacteria bacterium GW2011_GWC2_37_73]|nr:MAG: hypothetical protein UR95_C0003G0080 [Parcubacteria group bacterium GW2011_GWC1_36_108]KKP99942.1 MAG: hypothetical protein US09_C0027G0006 [Candidatus Moranbacteria bacterium GW2011_GWD1_36_198]KKQ00117.1 MAG: hypothetical protein US10_C0041G0006 [Candidatus Moranbacteria bacterium GW2011_GWD2_36_198]KKQ39428.1 MAG: hypothetical protein US57_C0013G0008 [Candidatus Moranbacteria bacterium GW2011_GWC2_37_73]HAS00163.1 hypothetical protein [Candidatus Moranbacteria bacterium]